MSLEDAILKLAEAINNLAVKAERPPLNVDPGQIMPTPYSVDSPLPVRERLPYAPASSVQDPPDEEPKPKKGRGRPKLEAVKEEKPAPKAPAREYKPKVEDPLADPFAEEEVPAPKPAPKAKAAAAQTSGTTKDEVLDALRQAVRVKGEDPVLALLQEFGGTRVSEIAPNDYAGLLARLEGMIDG